MSLDQHDRSWCLVDLAALDPDGAVLDHVDPADPVGAGKRVQLGDELGERQLLSVEGDGDARLEADRDLGRLRRGRGVRGERVGLLRRRRPRILERSGLDRAPEEVLVDRERRRLRRDDGNPIGDRVLDLLVAGPDPVAQRCDHVQPGVVRLERELEAQLVVALAGAAVHDGLGPELGGDLRDCLRDHRARERRDERILALVERVGLDRAGALLLRERRFPVDEHDVVRTGRAAPLDRRLEVELLPDVDEHGDDLVEAVPVLFQPAHDAARVEPTREGDYRGPGHLA